MNWKTIIGLLTASLCLMANLDAQKKPTVVSSASMIWDMVNEIGGDKIKNRLLVPIGGDPHIYEPTPNDAQKVATADLIFINGLTFEGWIEELIDNSGTKGETIIVTKGFNPISSSVYKNAFDPHAWMDVSLGLQYIKNIKDGLIKLDPVNSSYYEARHQSYAQKLQKLDKYIEQRVLEIPAAKRILITSHDAFSYYGRRYGLRVEGIMGISTESEAQTSDMVRVVKAIKESGVPAIFVESTVNPKLIQQIAKDNKIVIGGSLFADSIGDKDSGGNSYYDMLKHNTDVIVDALKADSSELIGTQKTEGSPFLTYGLIALVMLLGLLLLIRKMNQ